MTKIDGTSSTSTKPGDDIAAIDSQGRDIIGSGILGGGGHVPDEPLLGTNAYSVVLASLSFYLPDISGDALDVRMLEIAVKLKKTQSESEITRIEIDTEKKRETLTIRRQTIDDAQKKMDEAACARQNASVWDKIKLAFMALGAALMTAVGALLLLTPGAQALGGMMIGIGVVSLLLVADAVHQQVKGEGMVSAAMKASGKSAEEAATGDLAFRCTFAVVALIASVAMFFVPVGQLSAKAMIAQAVSTLVSALSTTITVVGDVAVAGIRFVASQTEANAKDLQAQATELDADVQQIDDFIDQALSNLIANNQRFDFMIDALADGLNNRGTMLSRVQFTS